MTVSSTDCKAWYNAQWDEGESAETDEATQAYSGMQRQVRHALEQEKRREAEADESMAVGDDTLDPLRAALPLSFGRPAEQAVDQDLQRQTMPISPASDEAPAELDYGVPEPLPPPPASTPNGSVLRRLRSLQAAVFGST